MSEQSMLERVGAAGDLRFEVGKPFPLPPVRTEGAAFSVEPYSNLLIYRFDRPTQEEIQEFKEGRVELAVLRLRGVLFFLSRFGRLAWSDAPYSTHLTAREKSLPELASGNRGYALDCFLVDSRDNVLKAHRLVRMPVDFSAKFKAAIDKDAADSMDEAGFNKAVGDVYANYSTADLLKFRDFYAKIENDEKGTV